MPNQLLKLLLKFGTLSQFEMKMIFEWQINANEQEINYFTKIINVFFAN